MSSPRALAGKYTAAGRRLARARTAEYFEGNVGEFRSLAGIDDYLSELGMMMENVDAGGAAIVRDSTERMWRDASARWDATAGMSQRNSAGRGGLKTTHRTQQYRSNIRYTFFDEGRTGSVYIRAYDFGARKVKEWTRPLEEMLAYLLEYGTIKMAARPHLIPAWRVAVPQFNRLMARLFESAVRTF